MIMLHLDAPVWTKKQVLNQFRKVSDYRQIPEIMKKVA